MIYVSFRFQPSARPGTNSSTASPRAAAPTFAPSGCRRFGASRPRSRSAPTGKHHDSFGSQLRSKQRLVLLPPSAPTARLQAAVPPPASAAAFIRSDFVTDLFFSPFFFCFILLLPLEKQPSGCRGFSSPSFLWHWQGGGSPSGGTTRGSVAPEPNNTAGVPEALRTPQPVLGGGAPPRTCPRPRRPAPRPVCRCRPVPPRPPGLLLPVGPALFRAM